MPICGADEQSVSTTVSTVPSGRLTFFTRASSVAGWLGSFDWSTLASPCGTTPPIAGPLSVVLQLREDR